ncbi:dihydroneopterin aldolase [Zavarzinia sp. CC-PAN008]|uniref:dihydroneopterin aldolase n=1 Tax=Zavarzinia sp. CC-PAN008 TaxID=3243332 RepID=UPI003F743D32
MTAAIRDRLAEDAGTVRAAPVPRSYRIFVRNLVVPWHIGIYPHEYGTAQRVRLGVTCTMADPRLALGRDIDSVVSYETIVATVRALAASGHVELVEILARQVAEACLADSRILEAAVTVEKLDVFPEAESAGVELVMIRPRSDT